MRRYIHVPTSITTKNVTIVLRDESYAGTFFLDVMPKYHNTTQFSYVHSEDLNLGKSNHISM